MQQMTMGEIRGADNRQKIMFLGRKNPCCVTFLDPGYISGTSDTGDEIAKFGNDYGCFLGCICCFCFFFMVILVVPFLIWMCIKGKQFRSQEGGGETLS